MFNICMLENNQILSTESNSLIWEIDFDSQEF